MIRALSIIAFLTVIVVVVLGAFTRLVDAGLGCPDWPTCYGHLWVPTTEAEIQQANQSFQQTPVETDKTWPEQIHRLFASSLGVLILLLFTVVVRKAKTELSSKLGVSLNVVVALLAVLVAGVIARIALGDSFDVPMLVLIFTYFAWLIRFAKQLKTSQESSSVPIVLVSTLAALVILQGFFGMWTVTLKLWPQVVTAHLLGGFATLSLLGLMVLRSYQMNWSGFLKAQAGLKNIRPLARFALIVVCIQIFLGGWTSSNYAALACPDFPLCQNQIWPQTNFSEGFNLLQDIGPNYLGGKMANEARTSIHLAHRLGAIVVLFVVALLGWKLWRLGRQFSLRSLTIAAYVLWACLVLQLSLGVMNIVLFLPLAVAVLHNAVGASLLLLLVLLNYMVSKHSLNRQDML